MIFKNILLHNVDQLLPTEDGGFAMLRAPLSVEQHLADPGPRANRIATGMELRFVIRSGTARIKILCSNAYVYYGNIQGGWQVVCSKGSDEPRWIEIALDTDRMPTFERIAKENNHPFSPQVVRIIPESGIAPVIYDVEGDVEVPSAELMPQKTIMAFGSSITHGSLSMLPMTTWIAQLADNLGTDYLNRGYSGSCHAEPEMVDYLCTLDFDCAIVSFGANMSRYTIELYEERARYLITTLCKAHPDRKFIFVDATYQASDIFSGEEGIMAQYRKIMSRLMAEYSFPNAKYVCGLELLDGSWGVSGDLVHPNIVGVNTIANRLTPIAKEWFEL